MTEDSGDTGAIVTKLSPRSVSGTVARHGLSAGLTARLAGIGPLTDALVAR